ncbi:MAG: hypothetical protein ACRENI_05530 [Gemmatimonadaceae bacterium]
MRYDAGTGKYTRRYPDGTTVTFSGAGIMESVEDRFGNATVYGYTGTQLTSIADPIGKITELFYGVSGSYGAPGMLAYVRDPAGRTTYVSYDPAGNVSSIVGPDGVTALTASFDSDHRLLSHTDRTGATTSFAYDDYGAVATVTAPEILTTDAGTHRPVTSIISLRAAVLPAAGFGTSSNPAARLETGGAHLTVSTEGGAPMRIWVHRSGAPTRIEREDPQGKLLVSAWSRNEDGQPTYASTPSGGSAAYAWNCAASVEM